MKSSIKSLKSDDIDFSKIDENNPYFYMVAAIRKMKLNIAELKVLDIGCGRERKYHHLDYYLADLGCDVTGIDVDITDKKISKNLRFIRCAVEDLDKKINGKFDVVISSFFFGYVSQDWAIGNGIKSKEFETAAMNNIRNVMKEDGICVHYINEPFALTKKDLEKIRFKVVKYPDFKTIADHKNRLLVLRKC